MLSLQNATLTFQNAKLSLGNLRLPRMVFALIALLAPDFALAVKTSSAEFGNNGIYDSLVTITRDAQGRMVFRDTAVTSPIALSALADRGITSHDQLSGLAQDDHPQYLSPARHSAAHSALFNGSLAIPADPAGHSTLGGHTSDASLHLRRDAAETIEGGWRFGSTLEIPSGRLYFSNQGAAGSAEILFKDSPNDASIRWAGDDHSFEVNRKLWGGDSEWTSVAATQIRCDETLSGRNTGGARSGAIEGFDSIEGIEPQNLLSRDRAETITQPWHFLDDASFEGNSAIEGDMDIQGDLDARSETRLETAQVNQSLNVAGASNFLGPTVVSGPLQINRLRWDYSASGDLISQPVEGENYNIFSIHRGLSDGLIRLRWPVDENGSGPAVTLGRNANDLHTTASLDCAGLKISGQALADSSRNLSAAGIQGEKTQWKDWAAAAAAGPGAHSYAMEHHYHCLDESCGNSTLPYDSASYVPNRHSWHQSALGESTHLECAMDARAVYFPIDYEAGTVLTRLRVKWQAQGDNDGVKVRLVKRDESGTETGWSVVGSQQSYTDASSPYSVMVSTYDFADETMGAGYSYSIEIESEAASQGCLLYAVGIESSKRVY